MERKIQVVSFQMPIPADYGGVIDVYYKLKALKQAGVYIIFHSFAYGRKEDEKIKEVADEVYYYRRRNAFASNLSLQPYISRSRYNKELITRIISIGAPVILEGLHTCSILKKLSANGIKVGVRMHNVEHLYYKGLAKASGNFSHKLFYNIESLRLKNFESVLRFADVIFTISQPDTTYYKDKFKNNRIKCVYPFYNDSPSIKYNQQTAPYVLYHGNMNVEENSQALEYILDKVFPLLNNGIKVVVAGYCNSKSLIDKMNKFGVDFINHPDNAELDSLVANAKVNLLISFQPTGVKLKLLKALSIGNGICIVNSNMVTDPQLRQFCYVYDNEIDIAESINKAFQYDCTDDEIKKRHDEFNRRFNNSIGAKIILENIAY